MYGAKAYLKEYRSTGLEGSVVDASPHRLISLLLSGARERVRLAQAAMSEGQIAAKGEAISRACAIVDSLRGSLDMAAGGEVAANLDALYDFISARLVEANLQNDPAALTEVDGLLGEVESAWQAIPAELQHGRG
jgi:flagellar protein FliS